MSKEISQGEYFEQCRAVSQDLLAEHDGDADAAREALHETVDGHEWIIYTHSAVQVLLHSPNDNAYFEDFGALEATDFNDAVTKMAFAAMRADCAEALGELLAEREEIEASK